MPKNSSNTLRLFQRPESPTWYIRGTVHGVAVKQSAGTTDRRIAETVRKRLEAEIALKALQPPEPPKPDVVTLERAIEIYSGAVPVLAPTTARHLLKILDYLKPDYDICKINQSTIDELARNILSAGAGMSTRRRAIVTPLRAVLTQCAERGLCRPPVFSKIKTPYTKTEIMLPEQLTALYRAAAPHLKPLIAFLVFTGARTAEAFEIEFKDIDFRSGRVELVQKQQRGRIRIFKMPPVLIAILQSLPYKTGIVFRPERKNGRGNAEGSLGYKDYGRVGSGQAKSGWSAACHRAGLPGAWSNTWEQSYSGKGGTELKRRQRRWNCVYHPHSLRHTWASWHYCMHRDLMLLKEEGDWSTTSMVERYTKLVDPVYKTEIEELMSLDSPLLKPKEGED